MAKQYLVNHVVPNKGDSIASLEYRKKLAELGYNFYQQIGSIGGASHAGTVSISNTVVTRK